MFGRIVHVARLLRVQNCSDALQSGGQRFKWTFADFKGANSNIWKRAATLVYIPNTLRHDRVLRLVSLIGFFVCSTVGIEAKLSINRLDAQLDRAGRYIGLMEMLKSDIADIKKDVDELLNYTSITNPRLLERLGKLSAIDFQEIEKDLYLIPKSPV